VASNSSSVHLQYPRRFITDLMINGMPFSIFSSVATLVAVRAFPHRYTVHVTVQGFMYASSAESREDIFVPNK
jgi:hypothetical protein